MNAAKGRLRTILHQKLYEPIDKLLRSTCSCKAETLWGYEKALTICGAWPIEQKGRVYSINAILDGLERFKYTVPDTVCDSTCRRDFDKIVQDARETIQVYFLGLCLDCIDQTDTHHDDNWHHIRKAASSSGCRVRHREPTRYFSFMGLRDDEDDLQSEFQQAFHRQGSAQHHRPGSRSTESPSQKVTKERHGPIPKANEWLYSRSPSRMRREV